MPAEIVYLGDVIEITLTATDPDTGAAKNLALYDTVKIVLTTPRSGTVLTLDATLPGAGTDGVARATTTPGQLNVAGNWSAKIVGFVGGTAYAHSWPLAFQVQ